VPERLHLTPSTVKDVAPELCEAVSKLYHGGDSLSQEPLAQAVFLAGLLRAAEDRAGAPGGPSAAGQRPWPLGGPGPDAAVRSAWERYADMLLGEDFNGHPYLRAAADPDGLLALLRPSCEPEFLLDRASSLLETFNVLSGGCPREHLGGDLRLDMFVRARLSLLSRCFQTSSESALVPVVDLMNHSESPGVAWHWDGDAREMVATAGRRHGAGEELLDSYGSRSNVLLSRTYGFTQHPRVEPSWSFVICPQCVHHVYEDFLPEASRGLQILLNSARMEDSLCTALNAAGSFGRDAGEFLRLVCARCMAAYEAEPCMQPALRALREARAVAPASAAWWEHLGGDAHLAAEESVRIRMSEYLCLLAHLEAVDCATGAAAEGACLERSGALRGDVRDALRALADGFSFVLRRAPVAGVG